MTHQKYVENKIGWLYLTNLFRFLSNDSGPAEKNPRLEPKYQASSDYLKLHDISDPWPKSTPIAGLRGSGGGISCRGSVGGDSVQGKTLARLGFLTSSVILKSHRSIKGVFYLPPPPLIRWHFYKYEKDCPKI